MSVTTKQLDFLVSFCGVKPGEALRSNAVSEIDLTGWNAAFDKAVRPLKDLIARLDGLNDADAAVASGFVQKVLLKLSRMPTSRANADKLEKYIGSSRSVDIVQMPNQFGILVDLKSPLLKELSALRSVF